MHTRYSVQRLLDWHIHEKFQATVSPEFERKKNVYKNALNHDPSFEMVHAAKWTNSNKIAGRKK